MFQESIGTCVPLRLCFHFRLRVVSFTVEAKKTRKVNALALEGKCRVVEVVFRIIQRQFKGVEADDVLERVDARTLQLNRPGFG